MARTRRFLLIAMAAVAARGSHGASLREMVEADWLRQAQRLQQPAVGPGTHVPTWADAAGAVDGVKNGRYAFHTAHEPNPWWQVDLGRPVAIARIVVYNRLDYQPGLHNADHLLILTSGDGRQWAPCYDNKGRHFGGVGGGGPLSIRFEKGAVRARFLRLQVRSNRPIYLHLDEVEVYAGDNAEKNVALNRPADQSSVSQWSVAKANAVQPDGKARPYPTRRALDGARRLAAELRDRGADTRRHEQALAEVEARLKAHPADAADQTRAAYLDARRAMRRLAFSDPALRMDRLLFVKRFTQETYPDVCLNHMPWCSRPGGDICILEDPFGDEPRVHTLLNGRLGPGHVRGIDLSWDGMRIVFGYAKAKSTEPPKGWRDRRTNYHLRKTEEPIHLFEVRTDGSGLRQLTRGEWSDLDPTYLPNGDIAFASERCGYSLQCNEYDKDETSCNLYAMKPDGSHIRRLSVSKDGDYLPHTLADGTIGYTRWEYQERGWAHIQSIWFVRPDGTGADALFKQHLNDPWALEDMRSLPGSRRMVAIATGHHTLAAGPVVVVDPRVGMNNAGGIRIVTPGVRPPEGGMSGQPVEGGGVSDSGGLYMTPWPVTEKSFLVAYGYGRQTDPTGYALYLIDVFGTKELIYRDPAISCFLPIPLRPRPRPPVIPDVTDPTKDHAVCVVSHVGRGVEGVDPKAIRYIRIAQRMPWPYDNTHGGHRYEPDAKGARNWTPARVLGTVPVASDGSACFRVPVDTAVYFQLLDENHMELRRMRSFINFQRGEVRGCSGCHETRAEAPLSVSSSEAGVGEPMTPVPPPWGTQVMNFLRDVQPVLDRHCVRCHSGLKPTGGLDLGGGLTRRHNRAYDSLLGRGLVSISNVHEDARITQALAFGSRKSKLVGALRREAHTKRVKLSESDWLRLVTWIDLNAPYHDRFINKRPAAPPYDIAADAGLHKAMSVVHARRCAGCHKAADVSRLDWIDVHRPEASLFLAAPLAREAGGTGKCQPRPVYGSRDDPDHQALLKRVTTAVRALWARPRRDVRSLTPPSRLVSRE